MQILLPLENQVYDFPVPDQLGVFYHNSIAKVCPFCLRLWAVLKHRSNYFSVQGTCCSSCGTESRVLPDYSPVPGSLLDDCGRQGTQWALLNHFPRALLEREFTLHLKTVK